MKLCLKGGISIDADSGPLGYFDAVVVEVKTFLLLFRLALAILCFSEKFMFQRKLVRKNNLWPMGMGI